MCQGIGTDGGEQGERSVALATLVTVDSRVQAAHGHRLPVPDQVRKRVACLRFGLGERL